MSEASCHAAVGGYYNPLGVSGPAPLRCPSDVPSGSSLDRWYVTTRSTEETSPGDRDGSAEPDGSFSKNERPRHISLASSRTDAERKRQRGRPIYTERRSLLASDLLAQQPLGVTDEARRW